MAITLYHNGRTPGQTQFGLDTFTEHWKAAESADAVLIDASVPQRGDAHPDYPFMFVTDRYCSETGEQASALDVVYMGCMKDDGEDGPLLPPSQQQYGTAVQSASSSLPMTGAAATSPLTLQFYANTSRLTFWTYNAIGEVGNAPEPSQEPQIISLTSNDAAYSPGSAGIADIIANFFMLFETNTIEPNEIVSGKFWQNTELKTVFYGPPIFQVFIDGDSAIGLFAQGIGYSVSDSLSVSGAGGSASLTVTAVAGNGAITGLTLGSASFTSTTIVVLDASGGTGTGAKFACVKFM